MIKILFIHHRLTCGGAEQALFDLVNLLDKTKFDISVLTLYEGGIWEQKFRNAGIKLYYDHSCQIKSSNPLVKAQNFVKRCRIRHARKRNGHNLVKHCFPQSFDIIVSYLVWNTEEAGFCKGAKSLRYIHGDVNTNPFYHDYIQNSLHLLQKYDQFICVSQNALNSFVSLTKLHNTQLVLNPIDRDRILRLSREKTDLDSGLPRVCAVGRLTDEKGFERLIRIHKNLLQKGYPHRLLIVGDGPDRDLLRSLVSQLDVESSVTLAGYSDNPYKYMANSDFLVCSSFTEGLPVVAMEALALGVPLVSAVPSIGELFGPEVCGIVCDGSTEELERSIEKMLADRDFLQQCREGAQARSSFFDGRNMTKKIESILIDLSASR